MAEVAATIELNKSAEAASARIPASIHAAAGNLYAKPAKQKKLIYRTQVCPGAVRSNARQFARDRRACLCPLGTIGRGAWRAAGPIAPPDLYWEAYERNSIDDQGLPLDTGRDYKQRVLEQPAHGVRRHAVLQQGSGAAGPAPRAVVSVMFTSLFPFSKHKAVAHRTVGRRRLVLCIYLPSSQARPASSIGRRARAGANPAPDPFHGRVLTGGVAIRQVFEFFRGGLPLARAFWLWGVLGGAIVSLFSTLSALALVTAGAPTWLAVLVFAAHIPWNLVLLLGVWRSAARPEVSPAAAHLARLAILAWVVVLSIL